MKSLLTPILNNKKLMLGSIVLFSLCCSLLFLLLLKNVGREEHSRPGTDYTRHHVPTVESLLNGEGVPFEDRIGILYPIGYPAFLVPIFYLSDILAIDRISLIVFVNVMLSAGSAYVLFLIARTFANKKIALLAALLFASYPFNLWLIKNPNTEIPFILLFFIGLYLYIKSVKQVSNRHALFAGILLGLAALIRPIIIVLPILFALLIFILLKKHSLKIKTVLASFIVISYCITLLPWTGYLYSNTGQLLPLSDAGPIAIAGGMRMLVNKDSGGDTVIIPKDVAGLVQKIYTVDDKSTISLLAFFAQSFRDQPIPFLKLVGIKMARSWYGASQYWLEKETLMIQFPYLVTALFAIIVLWRKMKDKITPVILIATTMYFWAFTTLVLSILRYMVPVMGLLMIFSAFTLYIIFAKIQNIWNLKKSSASIAQKIVS